MTKLLRFLAGLKDSPHVWTLSWPLLYGLAVYSGTRHHIWFIPILAMAVADFLPDRMAPNAQRIHFSLGFLSTVVVRWHHLGLLILPVAFVIEYVYDPRFEGDPWCWGGVTDFTSYALGAIVGLL